MQTDASAKQLVVERIKSATNILVTVSHDPSVDELSAALGLTLILNKMDKHATAVFSGKVPPAISFLQPDKTFENTVDSLRDFIIALDKEKADRLRYKVEDDVVRIFITPYRTVISQKDLQFSQGDFNVELVLAVGVEKREDLDTAITAHGRILHDAPVVTINNKNEKSSLGAVDWSDGSASSLCEMLMGLSESLQPGILDEQISTALLTGIVAATERFRNTQTSPKVMTMAAQLMASGANQQLIAAKLDESNVVSNPVEPKNLDGSKKLQENKSEKLKKENETESVEKPKTDGEMTIEHKEKATPVSEPMAILPSPVPDAPTVEDSHVTDSSATEDAEAKLDRVVKAQAPTISVDDLKKDLEVANQEVNAAAEESTAAFEKAASSHNPALGKSSTSRPIDDVKGDWRDTAVMQPSFGGTLNATTEEAAQDKIREDLSQQNHKLLSHDGEIDKTPPSYNQPFEPTPVPTPQFASNPPVSTLAPQSTIADAPLQYEETPAPSSREDKTLSELEASVHATDSPNSILEARAAVDAALSSLPFDPASEPLESAGAQSFGTISHDVEPGVTSVPVEPATGPDFMSQTTAATPFPLPNDLPASDPTVPVLPPLPDFTTLPPLPGEPLANPVDNPHPAVEPPPIESVQPTTPKPTDPGQFQLPGQS